MYGSKTLFHSLIVCCFGFTSLWFLLPPSFDLSLFLVQPAQMHIYKHFQTNIHPSIYKYIYLIFMCVWKCPGSLYSHYQLSQWQPRTSLWRGKGKKGKAFPCSPQELCLPSFPPLWLGAQMPAEAGILHWWHLAPWHTPLIFVLAPLPLPLRLSMG